MEVLADTLRRDADAHEALDQSGQLGCRPGRSMHAEVPG
jgi:hypothetical protein